MGVVDTKNPDTLWAKLLQIQNSKTNMEMSIFYYIIIYISECVCNKIFHDIAVGDGNFLANND